MVRLDTALHAVMSEVELLTNAHEPFAVVRPLGRGGCAEVYLARHPTWCRYVAIKRLLPEHVRSHEYIEMFRREAELGTLLDHPNVVRVLDFIEGYPLMLVMEYVDGLSASQLTQFLHGRHACCPMPAAVHIACEVLKALEYVHGLTSGGEHLCLVHRDVSHANVLVRRDGQVKLADFGVAWCRRHASREDFIVGKVGYMSPEQARGGEVDPRSDLFSVGVVLAELLMWRKLFPGATDVEVRRRAANVDLSVLQEHGKNLPASLRLILLTALEADPNLRFGSALEMRSALEQAAEGLQLRLGSESLTSLLKGWVP